MKHNRLLTLAAALCLCVFSLHAQTKSGGDFELTIANQTLQAGQEYWIPVEANLSDFQGYQFTLAFDLEKVAFIDMAYGVSREENFGFFLDQGVITTSWNEFGNRVAGNKGQEMLFTLHLRAKQNCQLNSVLILGERHTAPEAYNRKDQQVGVRLNFTKTLENATTFTLRQNTPNPFQDETVIGFFLPEADAVTLTVRDVKGQVLMVRKADFSKGNQLFILRRNELNANGALLYTVETSKSRDTKKMILLER